MGMSAAGQRGKRRCAGTWRAPGIAGGRVGGWVSGWMGGTFYLDRCVSTSPGQELAVSRAAGRWKLRVAPFVTATRHVI